MPVQTIDYSAAIWMLILFFGIPAMFAAGLLYAILQRQKRPATKSISYGYTVTPSLLTPTEAHFYQTLREAVGPLAVIQCKVRLADLLVAPRHDLTAFRRVSQKHVDFVLCQQGSLKPLACVELDDRSHEREDRQARDRFVDAAYAAAGLPLVHVPVQSQYNAAALLAQLQPFLIVDVWGRNESF